jgi:NitT/TauT family transport system permease protein
LIGIVVGELIAAQAGIGLLLSTFGTTFQMSKMFAALLLLAGTGVVLQIVLQRLERRFDAWRPRR